MDEKEPTEFDKKMRECHQYGLCADKSFEPDTIQKSMCDRCEVCPRRDKMEDVYVVVRNNPDIKDYFVEIKGIFKSKEEAEKHQEFIYERYKLITSVVKYLVMDTFDMEDE